MEQNHVSCISHNRLMAFETSADNSRPISHMTIEDQIHSSGVVFDYSRRPSSLFALRD